jgi:hypothetical protein
MKYMENFICGLKKNKVLLCINIAENRNGQ